MNSILFGISIAALLSTTSLIIVILRVSPLLSPAQALTAFFISLFLTMATAGSLCLMLFWKYVPHHAWDTGKLTSIAVRQGLLLAIATTVLVGFHVLGLLNWWIAILIYGTFILVELALEH